MRHHAEPLALANPLSEEAGYMRTSLLPGLLNMVSYNLNRGTTDVRLFEAGEVFEKVGDRHDERRHLGFVATGDAIAKSVHSAAQPYTFFHMKGDIEELLAAFEHQSLHFDAETPAYFHPGRSARAVMDGETVRVFGQLHPELAAARKLRQEVYLAEVMLDRLYRHGLREPRYQRISKFPAVERDFSFVFDDAVTFERIQSTIAELKSQRVAEFSSRRKSIAAKKSARASTLSSSMPSSSRRNAPFATTKWRNGRRRSSPSWKRWAACCGRNKLLIPNRPLGIVVTSATTNLLFASDGRKQIPRATPGVRNDNS